MHKVRVNHGGLNRDSLRSPHSALRSAPHRTYLAATRVSGAARRSTLLSSLLYLESSVCSVVSSEAQ